MQFQFYEHIVIINPDLMMGLILLLPVIALGVLLIIHQVRYYEAVGIMLAIMLNVPYLFLLNILAEHMQWWSYEASANSYYNVPLEIIFGWALFWGGLLPFAFRNSNILVPLAVALILDLWLMPLLSPIFILGDYWLFGETVLLVTCLMPSLIIFRLTMNRKHVLTRALIQSYIWGGWMVFLIPSIALFVDGKNIFDVLIMNDIQVILFLFGLLCSIVIGYMALFEFALVGKGTPIPFDPPQKLVTSGIYGHVANPLQISTLLIFVCFMLLYQSWMMFYAILVLIVYSEGFVRWHHSIDIEKRFTKQWFSYRKIVKNWIINFKAYSLN